MNCPSPAAPSWPPQWEDAQCRVLVSHTGPLSEHDGDITSVVLSWLSWVLVIWMIEWYFNWKQLLRFIYSHRRQPCQQGQGDSATDGDILQNFVSIIDATRYYDLDCDCKAVNCHQMTFKKEIYYSASKDWKFYLDFVWKKLAKGWEGKWASLLRNNLISKSRTKIIVRKCFQKWFFLP